MKRVLAVAMIISLVGFVGAPVFAAQDTVAGSEQYKNIETGARNVEWGWTEYMERTHQEAAKGEGAGEQMFGLVAGSAIGVRKGIHRIGAGAIDLLTFWIPKSEPLITPVEPPME